MKIQLELTKDHLKLIPFFLIKNDKDDVLEIDKERMLIISSSLLEDVSLILGLRDKAIKNTENDAEGRAFPDEIEEYMFNVYNYVKDNIYYIETLIHQFAIKGGITDGTYVCYDDVMLWSKIV